MITTQDKELLAKKGITEEQIVEQLACFQTGFPFLKLDAAASIEKGILAPDAEEQKAYLAAWDAYTNTDKTVVKFVPASGAASRMFKNLFEFLSADYDRPTTKFEQTFFDGIKNFAFYDDLNVACQRIDGKDIPGLIEDGNYKAVVSALLETAGLNYGALPKGLLKFHKYPEGSRTPMEEHLAEGALYAAGKSGKVNVHFTVSTEHRELFKKLVAEKVDEFSKRYGVDYYITFSEQKPSTDTIAADMDNQPFRDNGKLLFRPGGHGALIENLNDLDADIIFIKNIDNVVPDRLKADTVTYKKLIAGVLVTLQEQVFEYHAVIASIDHPRFSKSSRASQGVRFPLMRLASRIQTTLLFFESSKVLENGRIWSISTSSVKSISALICFPLYGQQRAAASFRLSSSHKICFSISFRFTFSGLIPRIIEISARIRSFRIWL